MAEIPNPHDAFFRATLSKQEAAREFVIHYLPAEVVALFDLDSLQVSKDSFVDEELRAHFSDLLYQVTGKDGRPSLVYLLFEHKSRPEPLVALDLLRYQVRIWRFWLDQRRPLPLPPIVPVVFYHGRAKWLVPRDFSDLVAVPTALEAYVPRFRYALCDLSAYSDGELKGALTVRAAMLLLKHVFSDDLRDRLPEIFRLLFEIPDTASGLRALETFLRYVVQGTDRVTGDDLRTALNQTHPHRGDEIMPTVAEQWREQGLQQGLQQGHLQGLQQGIRQGLLKAIEVGLELRFGVDGLRLLPEIRKLDDVDVLETIAEGAKTLTTIDEVRRLYQPPLPGGQ